MKHLFVAMGLALALSAGSSTSLAQVQIKTNEPVTNKLSRIGEEQAWTVVLPKRADTLRVEVVSLEFTPLLKFYKLGQQTITTVADGQGHNVPGWGVAGNELIAIADPNKHQALPAGRYTLIVRAEGGQGTGEYTIRVLDPTLKIDEDPLVKEIRRLREEMAELRTRIDAMEKQLADLEKEKKPSGR